MIGSQFQMATLAAAQSERRSPQTSAGLTECGTSDGSMAQPLDPLSPTSLLDTGAWLERAGRLEEAVACYQSSLACMPNHMGVSEWFMAYLLDRQRAPLYTTDFTAHVYEALARCLESLDRWEDASLAKEAARSLRGADASPQVQDFMEQTMIPANCTDDVGSSIQQEGRIPDRRTADALTIVMFTHFTNKLKKNAHLSPPETGLVEATYASLLRVFGDGIGRCPKILCYDCQSTPGHGPQVEYGRNLERFALKWDFDLHVTNDCGLLKTVASILQEIKTSFLFFLEHDWAFEGSAIKLDQLIRVFEAHRQVNSIRFNKRFNRVSNYDFILEREKRITEAALLRTPAVSNNPNLVRVHTLTSRWLPLCLADPVVRSSDLRGYPFGVEEPLFKHQMTDIRRLGFSRAHARWGTYLYGQPNDPPQIRHLGE
jgi:hypothetical protein